MSAAIYPDPNGFVMPPEIKAAVDYLYAAYKGWDVISGFDSICGNIEIDGVAFLRIGPEVLPDQPGRRGVPCIRENRRS